MQNTTTHAAISLQVTAPSRDRADHLAGVVVATVDAVWIITRPACRRVVGYADGSGVYRVEFTAEGPRHELTEDAPILRQALAKVAGDSLRITVK